MKILGITGPSGSGKTTLCGILEKDYGAKIIDADKVARGLSSNKDSEYFKEMKELFGEGVLKEDGSLNRKKVAHIIYTNKTKRKALNKLTFKYVADEILAKIEKLKKDNTKLVAIDVPLLYEAKMEDVCDKVIAVIANDKEKIARICLRDGIDEETAKQRLEIQNANSFFVKRADFVIKNDKTIDNLANSLKEILDKLWENGFQE